MSRFSPRVLPNQDRQIRSLGDTLINALHDRRARKQADEAREVHDALTTVELERQGIRRGTAPRRTVGDTGRDPAFFEDRGIGLQPDGEPGPSPLAGALGELRTRGRVARAPRMVAPPGSFVPGKGFSPRPVFEDDLIGDPRIGLADPTNRGVEVDDPRFRQLNEGFFLDTERTPEARAARAASAKDLEAEAERNALAEGLSRIRGIPRDHATSIVDLREHGFSEDFLFPEEEGGAEVTNRAAFEQLQQIDPDAYGSFIPGFDYADELGAVLDDARTLDRQRETRGGTDPGSGEVSRRARALGAARAVAAIQKEFTGNLRAPDIGERERRINAAIRPFGYQSVQELEAEMRSLGGGIAGQAEALPGGPSPVDVDARMNELLDEGLSEDEIIEVLKEEGLIGDV